jgi:hypothetical protein
MDSRGHIFDEEMMAKLDASHRERLTPIPANQERAVRGMNRKQRRAWLAQFRRTQRNASKGQAKV